MSETYNNELVNRATRMLSILSKKDALTIFLLAKEGLKAETDTSHTIGLTRKQYYTRLHQLVDAGLLQKSRNNYVHTTLGTLVHQRQLLQLLEQLRNAKQIKMIDVLRRNTQFSDDDIAKFLGKMMGMNSLSVERAHTSEITWAYEDMVSMAVRRLEASKNSIRVALRFHNEIILRSILLKARSGVQVRIVADAGSVEHYLNMDRHVVSEKEHGENLSSERSSWFRDNVAVRMTSVPFSMLMLDDKEAGIELIDATDLLKFRGSIFINSESVCATLSNLYEELWNNASPDLSNVNLKAAQAAGHQISRSNGDVESDEPARP
jgi:predicted transcriptional regulator